MFFRVVLDRRLGMYNQALRVAPLETAAELYRSVMESHHRWEFCVNRDLFFSISLLRNYFLSFGFFFLCIIFGFGLCFGRVTRRYLFLVYYLGADEKLESMSRTSEGADYGVFVWIHVSFTVQTCFCPGSMERWKIDESLKKSFQAHRASVKFEDYLGTDQRGLFASGTGPLVKSGLFWLIQFQFVHNVGLNVQWSEKFSVIHILRFWSYPKRPQCLWCIFFVLPSCFGGGRWCIVYSDV